MGNRIVVRIRDENGKYSPDYYGHWCGLEAVFKLDELISSGVKFNGVENLFCNFIVSMMGGAQDPYNHYVYNHGEAEGMADWDNYTWTYDMKTKQWTSTSPRFKNESMSFNEVIERLSDLGDE